MDRRTVLAFILIGLVIVLYPLYLELVTGGKKDRAPGEVKKTEVDTLISREEAVPYVPQEIEGQKQPSAPQDTTQIEKLVKVETDLYQATFSTRGANLKSFVLKEYEYSDGNKIEVIPRKLPMP